MIIIHFILSLFFLIYLQLFTFLFFILSFPLSLFSGVGRAIQYFMMKWSIRLLLAICFIRVKIYGVPKPELKEKTIFVSNYPSLMDPLYLIAYFPRRIRITAEPNMFKIPLIGKVMRSIGCIAIESSDGFAGKILNALGRGEPVWIFKGVEKVKVDDNLIKLAKICEARIVPFQINNSENILPRRSMLFSPGVVTIKIQSDV